MQEWTPNEYADSEDWKPPRWYQHVRLQRYGRNIYVTSPRVGSFGLHVVVYCFPRSFTLGFAVYQDEEGDWETQIGLGVIDIRIGRLRYLTKRKLKQRHERYLGEQARKLIDEVDQFLIEGQ